MSNTEHIPKLDLTAADIIEAYVTIARFEAITKIGQLPEGTLRKSPKRKCGLGKLLTAKEAAEELGMGITKFRDITMRRNGSGQLEGELLPIETDAGKRYTQSDLDKYKAKRQQEALERLQL